MPVLLAMVAGLSASMITSAAAAPSDNSHNCAGAAVSLLAGPGFGQDIVSPAAHGQSVDNFDLADCNQDNRNNP
jgi:hypothetical protein